jgi:hypothetical protein
MSDDRDDQQRNSFHWPPTTEELDSIQVIEVHDDAPGATAPARAASAASPWRAWWHRMMQEAVIAQVGLAAASLAAIGIALTSLLAPAQPSARTKNTARVAATAPAAAAATSTTSSTSASTSTPAPGGAAASTASAPSQVAAADPTQFQHMVTFAPPPPALEQVRAERQARANGARAGEHGELTPSEELAAAREERAAARSESAGGSSGSRQIATAAALPAEKALSQRPRAPVRATRQTVVARHATAPAGSDPVSRLATRTGLSVWKAMRAVGRSLKPDNVVATR